MANMNFDFNQVKRSILTVTLKNKKKLIVKMPMKKTFDKIAALQDLDTGNMSIDDAIDTLGSLVAEILSNNLNSEKVTTEYITENYDLEEMEAFIDEYMKFVSGVKNNPN